MKCGDILYSTGKSLLLVTITLTARRCIDTMLKLVVIPYMHQFPDFLLRSRGLLIFYRIAPYICSFTESQLDWAYMGWHCERRFTTTPYYSCNRRKWWVCFSAHSGTLKKFYKKKQFLLHFFFVKMHTVKEWTIDGVNGFKSRSFAIMGLGFVCLDFSVPDT